MAALSSDTASTAATLSLTFCSLKKILAISKQWQVSRPSEQVS